MQIRLIVMKMGVSTHLRVVGKIAETTSCSMLDGNLRVEQQLGPLGFTEAGKSVFQGQIRNIRAGALCLLTNNTIKASYLLQSEIHIPKPAARNCRSRPGSLDPKKSRRN